MNVRLVALLVSLAPALAEAGHTLCREAGLAAAQRHGVPPALMLAIGEVESARGGKGAWPWTLNVAGAGAWFDTRRDALAAARAALARGIRSIDLGCFQVNRRWHGAAFDGLDEMLDPHANADYAARFLADLKAEAGDWLTAAGWYHSRTPKHARRYRALVAKAEGRLAKAGPRLAAAPRAALPRVRSRAAGSVFAAGFFRSAPRSSEATGRAGGVGLSAFAGRQPLLGR